MMAACNSVAEDMVNWLETDEIIKQNPDAVKLKQCLMEMVASKQRRMSSSSGSEKSLNGTFIRRQHDATEAVRPVINAARYKTELCRSYRENGYCRYGDKCQFAHGAPELRTTARHPRYKTELCKAYHSTGFCAYGARCNFIHNDIEFMAPSIAPAAVPQPMLVAMPATTTAFPDPSWPLLHLGSTADSPPQSVTDSPSPSPTTMFFDSAFDVFPGLVSCFPFQTADNKLF